jgi:hypothetical protein
VTTRNIIVFIFDSGLIKKLEGFPAIVIRDIRLTSLGEDQKLEILIVTVCFFLEASTLILIYLLIARSKA